MACDFHGKRFNAALFSLEVSDALQKGSQEPGGDLQDFSMGFDDDTPLETIRLHMLKRNENLLADEGDDGVSDISDFSQSQESSLDCESGSDDAERKVELDGVRNSVDLVAPSDLSGKQCYRHWKSKKLHFVDKNVCGVLHFKCGRKCNENYEKLEVVPAFSLHGCLTCFGWSDHPAEESEQDD